MKCSFCNLGWQLPLLPTRWCHIAVTLVPLWKLIRIPQLYKLPHQHTHTHRVFLHSIPKQDTSKDSQKESQNYKNNYFLLQWFCSVEKAIICTLHSRELVDSNIMICPENSLSCQILVLFHGTLLRKKQPVDDRLEDGVPYFPATNYLNPFAGIFPCLSSLRNFLEMYLRLL